LRKRNPLMKINRLTCLSLALVVLPAVSGCRKQAASTAVVAATVQVIAIEARIQPVAESLSLTASITPNEVVEIKSETDGIVLETKFAEGERVTKGQVLVQLDDSKLSAEVKEADAILKLSQANHERTKQLHEDKLISQQDYDQAASTFAVNQAGLELKRRQLQDARITAPFSGIVGARQISPGQVINRSLTLTVLVDLDTVKVEVKVPEKYLRELHLGQAMDFSVAAYPDEKFHGEVYFISPQIEEGTRTALVKARIPNTEHKLRGGMFASLDLTLKLRDSAIVIPEPALMSNGDHFSVFVIDEKGEAQTRPVEVGYHLPGRVEITKGLNAGDKVVVEGLQKLRPGSPVKLSPPEAAAIYNNPA